MRVSIKTIAMIMIAVDGANAYTYPTGGAKKMSRPLSKDGNGRIPRLEYGRHSLQTLSAEQPQSDTPGLSRRQSLGHAASMLAGTASLFYVDPSNASTDTVISASWSAVDGLNSLDSQFVSFDESAYTAMRDDPTRTPLFRKAIERRLRTFPPATQTVLDMGTGPFAIFAIIAAEAGAEKVFAIEADPAVAKSARESIERAGFSKIITVVEGFSSEITLPAKVDLIVAEIVGSIASEEGAYATIRDAHARFLKNPSDPGCWIPHRIQTFAAPASYTLHTYLEPPEFDWSKLKGEPVRFNCRDDILQLLADPIVVEDIEFEKIDRLEGDVTKDLTFTVDKDRMEGSKFAFYDEFRKAQMPKEEAARLANAAAHSVSGIAFWPRLVLDAAGTIVVNSRGYPTGAKQRSHWQTVLPIMADRPVGDLKGGEQIKVRMEFHLPKDVKKPASYRLDGVVTSNS